MRQNPLNSIRFRMTAAFTAATGVVLAASAIALVTYMRHDIEGDSDQTMKSVSEHLASDLLSGNLRSAAEYTAQQRTIYGNNLSFVWVAPNGKIAASAGSTDLATPNPDSRGWRTYSTGAGPNRLVVGLEWNKLSARFRNQTAEISLFCFIILATGAVGAWVLVGRTLRPISQLSQQARDATVSSLHVRLNAPSHDTEIIELVTTLNSMLSHLESTAAMKGRLYAAASHELRTPLQALAGHLELAASRDRTPDEYRDLMQEAYSQARKLVNLTRDLLLLNQVEISTLPESVALDLGELCDRVADLFGPQLAAAGAVLEMDRNAEAELHAPATHAEMLVRNLIENAVKYVAQNGVIRVHIDVKPTPKLTVFNSCPRNPDWVPERTFEAFYRPDPSRSSVTGGNGLGLAICKAICNRNGWHIEVAQVEGGVLGSVIFGSE